MLRTKQKTRKCGNEVA